MRLRVTLSVSVALALATSPAVAQFSSDIPGVPRASLPFRGNHQNRTAWTFSISSLPAEQTGTDTEADGDEVLALGARLGFGQSYRVRSRWELGYEATLADGFYRRAPGASTGGGIEDDAYLRGLVLYALRVGVKLRPIQMLSPEGYGFEAAVGASFQPSLEPVYSVAHQNDTTYSGGVFKDQEEGEPELVESIHRAMQFAGMASYRSRRFLVDAALVYEATPERSDTATGPGTPLVQYSGLSPRIGAEVRLTPSLAVGASAWGRGSPPWSDQVRRDVPDEKKVTFAPFLSLGSKPESGIDLMLISPSGSFAESARLLIRMRSTR